MSKATLPALETDRCVRCRAVLHGGWIMSKFNEDIICVDCKTDEQLAPGYAAADAAECEAVRARRYAFSGPGLTPEDRTFLIARIRARREEAKKNGEAKSSVAGT